MKTRLAFPLLLAWSGAVGTSLAQPVIVIQPTRQTNVVGATVTLCVTTTGSPPLSYQWQSYTNGVAGWVSIVDATNTCLDIPDIQPPLVNISFRVMVSNPEGSTNSATVRVYVVAPPVITKQPSNQVVELSSAYTTAVVASNINLPPVGYQWYFNGQRLAGKTSLNISLANVQPTNAGDYQVVVTNMAGSVTSQVARLTVIDARFAFTQVFSGPGNDGGIHNGCEWVDYNNDGLPDLYVIQGYSPQSPEYANRLYRNNGDGTFTLLTSQEAGSIVSDLGDWIIATWGDYDNDGWMDAYVTAWSSPNALFRNNGDGTFTRVDGTEPTLTPPGRAAGAPWGDFDNDGLLDLFVARSWDGYRSSLYRNTDGGFVSVPGPLSPGPVSIEGSSWCDYDNDGDLDLILADPPDEGGQGLLVYRNDGAGNFTPVTAGALTSAPGFVLSAAFADYDNDGLPDVCVASGPSLLYHNDGHGQFTQRSIGALTGASCALWGDYDNDGHLDLFICGSPKPQFLRNNGDGTFTNLRNIAPVRDADTTTNMGGWADYDNDGFLDLLFSATYNLQTNLFFFHNAGNSNHWLLVKLVGTVANRAAIGAKVRVKATIQGTNYWQLRELTHGTRSGDDLRAHFGLGDATNVETLRVEWPSGQVTDMRNVASKQFLTIVEPNLQVAGISPEGCQLNVAGRIGSRYDLSTSSNLVDWVPWRSVTNTSGTMTISDPESSGQPRRFYKSVQP
jgi:enediyne biosynthesis protein E4